MEEARTGRSLGIIALIYGQRAVLWGSFLEGSKPPSRPAQRKGGRWLLQHARLMVDLPFVALQPGEVVPQRPSIIPTA